MSHRRSAVKGSLSFSHPAVRAWLFQIIAIVAVVLIAVYLIHNTITNLNNRGITSGFAFLDRSAGFGIVQHLIDYQEGDTYGRVFVVGLLNTLLVSRFVSSSRRYWASLLAWRVFLKTGFCGNCRLFTSRRSAISPRSCRSSSGISPYCVTFPVPARPSTRLSCSS